MLAVYATVYTLFATSGLSLLRRTLDGATLSSLVRTPTFLVGGACYAVSFAVFLLTLRRYQVLTVFPLFNGLAFVGVTLAGVAFLGEHLTLARLSGIALVAVAVTFLSR